jgi:hypothetical protein
MAMFGLSTNLRPGLRRCQSASSLTDSNRRISLARYTNHFVTVTKWS